MVLKTRFPLITAGLVSSGALPSFGLSTKRAATAFGSFVTPPITAELGATRSAPTHVYVCVTGGSVVVVDVVLVLVVVVVLVVETGGGFGEVGATVMPVVGRGVGRAVEPVVVRGVEPAVEPVVDTVVEPPVVLPGAGDGVSSSVVVDRVSVLLVAAEPRSVVVDAPGGDVDASPCPGPGGVAGTTTGGT